MTERVRSAGRDAETVMDSIMDSVRARRPIKAGGSTSEAMAQNFMNWADENMSAADAALDLPDRQDLHEHGYCRWHPQAWQREDQRRSRGVVAQSSDTNGDAPDALAAVEDEVKHGGQGDPGDNPWEEIIHCARANSPRNSRAARIYASCASCSVS